MRRGINLKLTGPQDSYNSNKNNDKAEGGDFTLGFTLVYEREYTAFISLSCYQNFSKTYSPYLNPNLATPVEAMARRATGTP